MAALQHTYRDCLKVVVKTFAKHSKKDQVINNEIYNDQYINNGARMTRGKGNVYQRFHKRVLIKRYSVV